MATPDLALEPVPIGAVSGTVAVPAGIALSSFQAFYRFPYPGAVVTFPNADVTVQDPLTSAGAFAYQLPDLRALGAKLCVAATGGEGSLLRTERCGLNLDAESTSLELQAAPSIVAPKNRTSYSAEPIDVTTAP